MEIYWETITPVMREVMITFGHSEMNTHFYLAGGTALALRLGHRRSFVLDFFSPSEDIPSIRRPLEDALHLQHPSLVDASWGNLVFLVGSLRVGFYGYSYPMVAPFDYADAIRLANIADIGLMKLDALLARASRKDFHDLYAIARRLPLKDLLDLAPKKYPSVRDFEAQVVKRLAFFERADQEEPLLLLQDVQWNTVKEYFRQQAVILGRSWLS